MCYIINLTCSLDFLKFLCFVLHKVLLPFLQFIYIDVLNVYINFYMYFISLRVLRKYSKNLPKAALQNWTWGCCRKHPQASVQMCIEVSRTKKVTSFLILTSGITVYLSCWHIYIYICSRDWKCPGNFVNRAGAINYCNERSNVI